MLQNTETRRSRNEGREWEDRGAESEASSGGWPAPARAGRPGPGPGLLPDSAQDPCGLLSPTSPAHTPDNLWALWTSPPGPGARLVLASAPPITQACP